MNVATPSSRLYGTRRRQARRLPAIVLAVVAAACALGAMPGVAQAESTSTSCAGIPGKWYVAPPREGWEEQCQMVNDPNVSGEGLDRETWVLDPGRYKFLTRGDLLGNAGSYERFGFSRRFLWYAPMRKVEPDPNSKWSACFAEYRALLKFCAKVDTSPSKTIGQDFYGSDRLDAIAWGGNWIALACGNFHVPLTSGSPAPVIHAFKYDDHNRDGRFDDGEHGLGGITFTLSRIGSFIKQPNASNLATTTSGSDGHFSFTLGEDDGPGVYVVTEHYTSNWPNTTPLSQEIVVPEGAGDGEHLPTLMFGDRQEIPPVAIATPQQADQQSVVGAEVTLDGSKSYSPTGDPLTYKWEGPFHTATGARLATVEGVHPTVWMSPGTHEVTLTVSDAVKSTTTSTTVTVYPPITAHTVAISETEGHAFEGTVATFTDPDPNGAAADYAATIHWGDGAESAGTIAKGAGGTFTVAGRHVYADEGSYRATVTITDDDVAYNTATAVDAATIADAALHAKAVDFLSTNPVHHKLATFTDEDPQGTVSDFTATIDWGDGTPEAQGQVSGPAGGPFTVTGNHAYATLGYKTITVHVVDDGGSAATVVDHVIVYQRSGFVIGDLGSAIGSHVTFWAPNWARVNRLSGGPAPNAFKGYAAEPGASTTLSSWTTTPGGSSEPPASVPTFMSVIVSSTVSRTGPTIVGDAPHIAIVQTDAGYGSEPGERGTGTVVAMLR